MICLKFNYSHGPYHAGDVATWDAIDWFVRQALTAQPRYVQGKLTGRFPAAEVVTQEERDRLLAERRAMQEDARARKAKDEGIDLICLTDDESNGRTVGDVAHVDTEAAAELLRATGPYFADGIEIGTGPVYRPATQQEKQLDARARVARLLAERDDEDGDER